MMLTAAFIVALAGVQPDVPVLGIEGTRFTLNGAPTFMLGCSYYGALGMEDAEPIEQDLDDLRELGFNWVRVWAMWDLGNNDVSAVDPSGAARPRFMERLKRLCDLAGKRGMVVDVTVSRGPDPFPHDHAAHLAVVRTLASELKPYRNVYIDVGNERDIGDARHVSSVEVGELIAAVKTVDPDRICTASSVPTPETLENFLSVAKMDFVAPHLGRYPEAPGETAGYMRRVLKAMESTTRQAPILLQEPFRRGYQGWAPTADDFMTDLIGGLDGGAAGWCFHNGATRDTEDFRPRRSFDMAAGEGRLLVQLDEEELSFFDRLSEVQSRLANWPE